MNKQQVGSVFLAAWLQENYPDLYKELAMQAGAGAQQHLSGFTDFLSSLGSGIASAAGSIASGLSAGVQSVGSYLGSAAGQSTLSQLAQAYGSLNASTISAQQQRAAAGQTPAIINTRYDPATGTYVPTYSSNGQTYPVNPAALSAITPGFFSRYGIWILGGAAALFLVAALVSRHK